VSENYEILKEKMISALEGLRLCAEAQNINGVSKEILSEWIPKLQKEQFQVMVLGEFNHGKSTLINALLNTDILPTGPTPTTGLIYRIQYAETESIQVNYPDRTENISRAELKDYSIDSDKASKQIQGIGIHLSSEFLKENLVFIDTPGTNDINAELNELIYHYIPRADLIIFILDCGQPLKITEQRFLAHKLFSFHRNRILFILNKADLVTHEELRETEDFVVRNLKKIFGDITFFRPAAPGRTGARN